MDLKIYTKLLLEKKQFNFFPLLPPFSAALMKGGAKPTFLIFFENFVTFL